ncbi:MAG: hypothetical protein ACRCZJ_09670 [Erysipelotrichaceae bacterium]
MKLPIKATANFSDFELSMLADLLEQGQSLRFALQHFSKAGKLREKLANGDCMVGKDVTKNKNMQANFDYFHRYLDTNAALRMSVSIAQKEKKRKETWLAIIRYPLLLIACSLGLACFFQFSILPQMQELVEPSMQQSITLINLLFGTFCLALVVIVVLVALLLCFPKWIVKQPWFDWLGKHTWMQAWMSYRFAFYLAMMQSMHIPTRHAFLLLCEHQDVWIAQLALSVKDDLVDGVGLLAALKQSRRFSACFLQFLQVGFEVEQPDVYLEQFLYLQQHRLQQGMQRFAKLLQAFSYGSCAWNVLCIYRMLLEPLRMLDRF